MHLFFKYPTRLLIKFNRLTYRKYTLVSKNLISITKKKLIRTLQYFIFQLQLITSSGIIFFVAIKQAFCNAWLVKEIETRLGLSFLSISPKQFLLPVMDEAPSVPK